MAHGLIVRKITYCLSCFANCPGYLKKRMQEILSETAKIVHGERKVKLKYQFQELDWLTLEGWIKYLDVLKGKTIGDFRKQRLGRTRSSEQASDTGLRSSKELQELCLLVS